MAQEDIIRLHDRLTDIINSPDRGPDAEKAHDDLFAETSIYVSYPPQLSVPTTDVPDLKIENLNVAVADNTVFAESILSGTYKGAANWFGVARPGSKFSIRVSTVTTFDSAGKVSRRALYWDKETLVSQLSGQALATARPTISFQLQDNERALLAEFGLAAAGPVEYGYH